ncbi:hypothetical protein P7C73_g4984, partial [Tremellales sp. Uapishka_1]
MAADKNSLPDHCLRWDNVQQEYYLALPSRPGIRLTLRRKTDEGALVELFNSPKVLQYSYNKPRPFTLAEANLDQAIEECRALSKDLSLHPPYVPYVQGFPFRAIRNSAGKLVGVMNVNPKIDWKRATLAEMAAIPPAQQTWHIAYDLLPKYSGQDVMSEVVDAVLNHWIKPYMRIGIVRSFAEEGNAASRRVLEKSGFRETREEDLKWPEHNGGGTRRVQWYELQLGEA